MRDQPVSNANASDEIRVVEFASHNKIPHATAPVVKQDIPEATSKTIEEAAELGIKLVEAEREGNQLFLTVEGDHIERVTGADGRRLAYDARHYYSFENAGIEPYGGTIAIGPEADRRYRQVWKLTRSIV